MNPKPETRNPKPTRTARDGGRSDSSGGAGEAGDPRKGALSQLLQGRAQVRLGHVHVRAKLTSYTHMQAQPTSYAHMQELNTEAKPTCN